MSIKDQKFRRGLRLVIVMMLGMVVSNSINDFRVYQGNRRRLSILREISTLKPADPGRFEVVRR